MNVVDVLKARDHGTNMSAIEASCLYHLWGIYADKRFNNCLTAWKKGAGSGEDIIQALGLTGAYPVCLLYQGIKGSHALFKLVPQYRLVYNHWVHFPPVEVGQSVFIKCPIKLYRRFKNSQCKEERLTMRWYYNYMSHSIQPLKPDDWINRGLIKIASERLECQI